MSSLTRRAVLCAALWLAMLGVAVPRPAAASLRVNPLIIYITPGGAGSSSVIELTNVTDVQLAFEVNVVKRTVVDGNEVDVPADDDFVIFPPQMIIKAHGTQTMRVQWVVGEVPKTSVSYYVYVTQVPVKVDSGQSGIRVSYRFGISAHVVPPGIEPGFEVTSIRPGTNDKGVKGFFLDVRNAGSSFGRLSEYELTLAGSETWDRKQLKEAVGIGFLLPDQRTTFFVPFDGEVTAASTATLAHRGPE